MEQVNAEIDGGVVPGQSIIEKDIEVGSKTSVKIPVHVKTKEMEIAKKSRKEVEKSVNSTKEQKDSPELDDNSPII